MVTLNLARRNSAGEKTKTCNKRRRDIWLRSQPVRETRTRGAMNNNLNKSRAYLGVFSDAGYIDVGTKVRDPSAPRAPARSPPLPSLPRESISGAPTSQLSPLAHATDLAFAPTVNRRSPCPTPSRKPSILDFTAGSSSPTRRRPALTAPRCVATPAPIPRFDFPKWHKKIPLFAPSRP